MLPKKNQHTRLPRGGSGDLQALFHGVQSGIAILDARLCYRRVNPAYARALSQPMTYFSGRNHFDLFPDLALQAIFTRVVETQQPHQVSGGALDFLPAKFWDWTLQPLTKTTSLALTLQDVTERVENEQSQKRNNALVQLLQSVATAANESQSVSGALEYAINRLCKHLGWPLGHALLVNTYGDLTSTSIWGGARRRQFATFREASESATYPPGSVLAGEALNDRQTAWIDHLADNPRFVRRAAAQQNGIHTGIAIPIIAGKDVVGVLEFFHTQSIAPDPNLVAVLPHVGVQLGRVVERTRAEDALRQTAAQLRLVITNLPVILWATDSAGKLLLLEGQGVVDAHVSTSNMIGKNIYDLVGAPAIQPSAVVPLLNRAQTGEAVHEEVRLENGRVYETFLTPYASSANPVEGIIGLAFDVTERKSMEADLEELRHHLTSAADNERARLAHQLHDGPLQDLYGAYYQLQEIQNEVDPAIQETVQTALQTIQTVNANLRVIVGELHPNALVHLGLARAIRSHAERLIEQISTGAADDPDRTYIALDLDEDQVTLNQADLPFRIRLGLYRVYQQLIENAARHSSARHVWVRLRLAPATVILEIQDDGRGFHLPPQWVNLVREGKFGLAGALERVEGMHGTLTIQSDPEHGTLARVTIPRV